MRRLHLKPRTWALFGIAVALLTLLGLVAIRSGPFAPVAVTTARVQSRSITPALFGIGTVQVRYTYKIGPTTPGRLRQLDVHVGEHVRAGQVLGQMDPVDLDDRIRAQQAASASGEAAVGQAQAKQAYAQAQAERYRQLRAAQVVSAEAYATKRQDLEVTTAALQAARADLDHQRADLQALRAQRANLNLVSPVDGLVATRDVDPGSTLVAGQTVVEIIDPASIWVDARFDQINAAGLSAGRPVRIALRSRQGQSLGGRVLRVDPLADAVTEETSAKIVFDASPTPLPPLGELAEVTVQLPAVPAAPTIPNAAIRTLAGELGVWRMLRGKPKFTPVALGRSDLDGNVQVARGLTANDSVIVYSEAALTAHSRVKVVARIPAVVP